MGVSDRPYFAWLRGALERYEAQSGALARLAVSGHSPELWVLAGARTNPAIDFVTDAMNARPGTVRFMDKFDRAPGVEDVDLNDLKALPDDACDVLMMSRASYMVRSPEEFLDHVRRIVRPGGAVIIDWIHGGGVVPALDLDAVLVYDDQETPFVTTYCDAEFVTRFGATFDAFLRHVNRPPGWVDVDRPGVRAPLMRRLGWMFAPPARSAVTRATCLATMRTELERAGKRLIEPALMAQHFTIAFRDAAYLYPRSRKFYLYLLTVLRPVGK